VGFRGEFSCMHGTCIAEGRDDDYFRAWFRAKLAEESGGLVTHEAQLDFDAIDPASIPVPVVTSSTSGTIAAPFDPWDEPPPAPWPGDVLPKSWETEVAEYAWVTGYDPAAVMFGFVWAASAAVDKRLRLRPYAGVEWLVPPIVWVMWIAHSGQRKTGVQRRVLAAVRRAHEQRMRTWARAHQAWRGLPLASRRTQPEPEPQTLLINDTTMEALQHALARAPRGMLYARDEVAGLLEMDRYSTGSAGSDRAFLLESYEGGAFTTARIKRGNLHIDPCALTIGGAIQPRRLAGFTDLGDDGLLQRFCGISLAEVQAGEGGTEPPLTDLDAAIERLVSFMPFGDYGTEDGGEALIRDTESAGQKMARTLGLGAAFEAFANKLHGLHARLAFILHLMNDPTELLIPTDTVERAGRLTRFVLDHALPIYQGLAGITIETTRSIASYLLRTGLTKLTTRTLLRNVAACRGMNLKQMQIAVEQLVNEGWLHPAEKGPDNREWLVRPGLAALFPERLKAETQRVASVKQAMNWRGVFRRPPDP